jgi:hypothetical protein
MKTNARDHRAPPEPASPGRRSAASAPPQPDPHLNAQFQGEVARRSHSTSRSGDVDGRDASRS